MIPGLNFFITRLLPIFVVLTAIVGGAFALWFVTQNFWRALFDYAAQTMRDSIRWTFTPKNFIMVGPLLLVLLGLILFLIFARYL